ncbi:DUF1127 domain-containing protein [Pseudomonas sp. NPDC089734]|uniref:DUF1127 domain-containing protein n=1 Tax=Pseudomonas sp. NPDC089734 TaxID=3364469 RepID=UPI0037FDD4E0
MMKGQKGYVLVARPAFTTLFARFWTGLKTRAQRWVALHQQRQLLASMSDETLKDLGLSRADILRESERPFWDDPR